MIRKKQRISGSKRKTKSFQKINEKDGEHLLTPIDITVGKNILKFLLLLILGTPLVTKVVSSKESDTLGLIKTVNEIPIELNTLNNSKINRYKKNFLADAGYCRSVCV